MPTVPASGTVRAARAQDRAAIINVARATGLFPPDALTEVEATLDGFLTGAAAADRWLITDTGTSTAATAYYAPERMTDGTWNLYLLAVHPHYQGQGRGAALVRHVEQDLREAGARVLLIETSGVPGFAGQRAFYTGLGYREEARIRDFYEPGDDKVIYWKALRAATSGAPPVPDAPAVSVAGAIARMEAIAAALPAADGLACFNRMYLDVTRQVNSQLGQGFFADPAFMTQLDVAFANLYFAAAAAGTPAAAPLAWRPLAEQRAVAGIEPVQFALAGMNAHVNHDLPIAMVSTCTALATAPGDGPHFADYQKVDQLLDAAGQSVRQSLESAAELAADRHLAAVANLVTSWTITSARDLAWNNCLLLWAVRDDPIARGLFLDTLAASTALASKMLLVAV